MWDNGTEYDIQKNSRTRFAGITKQNISMDGDKLTLTLRSVNPSASTKKYAHTHTDTYDFKLKVKFIPLFFWYMN